MYHSWTKHRLISSVSTLFNHLLPSYCHLCGASSREKLCSRCEGLLPVNVGRTCTRCDVPLASDAPTCANCLKGKGYYDRNISAFKYEFPVDKLLLNLKNKHEHFWAHTLGDMLAQKIRQRYDNSLPEVLVPIPLHWTRHMQRGYNQSAIICRYLSRSLNIPYQNLLKKRRSTHPQRGLDKKHRIRNLSNSFTYISEKRFEHVALVDDVMTTGATAETAAKILLDSGAEKVDIWTIARTPYLK